MEPYTIRRAAHEDLDRLAELMLALQDHLEACNPELWRMKAQARKEVKGQVAGRLKATDAYALVADHAADGVVGAIFGRVATNKRYVPERAGLIDQAFVCEDHRRAGVGSRLVAELCHLFAEDGVDEFSLRYVIANEEAQAFWTALGFSPRIVTAGAAREIVQASIAQKTTR